MENSKKFKISGAILADILIIAGLAGCSKKVVKKNVDVRVGYFPNITHSQALVGREQGSFQKAIGTKNKLVWKLFNAGLQK